MAIRDYKNQIGIGYTESTNRVRITIPDKMKIASEGVWCWLYDQSTFALCVNRPLQASAAVWNQFYRKAQLDGCREISLDNIKHIGSYFTMQSTRFRWDGNVLMVSIPPEHERAPPRKHRPCGPAPEPTYATLRASLGTMTRDVLIDLEGDTLEFAVPADELEILMAHWKRAGYAAS